MLAVFVNCGAIILGSVAGLVLSSRFSRRMEEVILCGSGFITLVLGMQMAFRYQNIIFLTLAVILGGITGTALDLDAGILSFGKFLERLVVRKKKLPDGIPDEKTDISSEKNFAYAFLNASVLFCVGAMSILGSFKAGIEKDYSIIFTKSILDGFMAVSFAAAMGIGTAFSALAVFLYQGGLTLLSVAVQPFVSETLLAELTGSGGVLICMIGVNLIGLKKIKTANYLPAVIFTVLFVLLEAPVRKLLGF